jgi:hypothetical protein
MKTITKTLAALAIVGLGAAAGISAGRANNDDLGGRALSANKGASFNVGTKKAVTFYENQSGVCAVTVMVSETFSEQLPFNLASTRFSANVAAGTTAEVSTSDGAALSLTCTTGAKSLVVESIDQVAYIPSRATN